MTVKNRIEVDIHEGQQGRERKSERERREGEGERGERERGREAPWSSGER